MRCGQALACLSAYDRRRQWRRSRDFRRREAALKQRCTSSPDDGGKRRLHQKPVSLEIRTCRPWFERELELVQPRLVVAMGATAVQSIFGKTMPIGRNRGRVLELSEATRALITVHPSYLLRMPAPERKAEEYWRFVEDLRLSKQSLA